MKTLSFITLLLLSFTLSAADIKVGIDRKQIELNESFTLSFEASDSVDDDPDFSPLEKDFQILNNRTSSNMSIINGQYSRSQRWNVTLVAKRKGKITIPSISFGKDKSPQYTINIKAVKKSSGKTGEDFMSELNIDVNSAYPQSQIIITQRMLSSRNINGYEFSQLQFSGVEVNSERLGDIKQYQTTRGNKPYLVLEQSYAVFPQSAGTLKIQPSIASARVVLNNNAYRSNTKTIRRASDEKTITIQNIPENFKGKHWIAAKELQLVEEFPENKAFKVGEPITRTLLLVTDGQSASQQPEFDLPEIKGLKQYPDQPLLKDDKSETGITGMQQVKVALIPAHKGSFTLPAISVPWWNTQTNKMEVAKIPARTFNVQASSANTSKTNNSVPPKEQSSAPAVINEEPENALQAPVQTNTDDGSLLWKLIALFFAIAWLITLFLYWLSRRKPADKNNSVAVFAESKKSATKKLKAACDSNDPGACKDALINWANTLFINKPVYSLGELASRVDKPLADRINSLNNILYTQNNTPWNCDNLYSLCVDFMNKYEEHNEDKTNSSELESLYK